MSDLLEPLIVVIGDEVRGFLVSPPSMAQRFPSLNGAYSFIFIDFPHPALHQSHACIW
jgi:hypothetical protein